MSSEKIVWTQEAHLRCSQEIVETLAHSYVQEFKENKNVQVIRWGYTCKQRQGFIIMEWDGEVDEAFLDRLEKSKDIQDFYIQGVSYEIVSETSSTSCNATKESFTASPT